MVNVLVDGLVDNSWGSPNLASAWHPTNMIENLPGAIVSINSVSTEVLLDLSNVIAGESWASLTNVSWGLPPWLPWRAWVMLAPFVGWRYLSNVLPLVRLFDNLLELGVSAKVEWMLSSLLPGFSELPEGSSTLLNRLCPSRDLTSRIGTRAMGLEGSDFLDNVLLSSPSGMRLSCLGVVSYWRPEASVSSYRDGCDRMLPMPLGDQSLFERYSN